MKILLINANWALDKHKYTMSMLRPYKITPIELCYIAGGISPKNEIEIYDAYALEHSWEETREKITSFRPEICVATTAPTYLFWRSSPLVLSVPKKLISIIKENSSAKTVLTGPHGTITPNYIRKEIKPDYIIRGECDLVVSAIINSRFKAIKSVPGVCSKNHISRQVAKVKNLDDIPMPRLDLLDLDLYEAQIWPKDLKRRIEKRGGRFILAEASRGCPNNCVFCQRDLFRKAYREKSAERMKKEIDLYEQLGVSYIYFIDETGSIVTNEKKKWLEYLATKKIKFGVQANIDQTSKSVVDSFIRAGCVYLEFGLETVDKDLHKLMMKNLFLENLEYAREKIDTIVCFELNFYSSDYIELLGIKSVKEEALFERPIIPYPGSPLGRMLLKKYHISEDDTWDFALRYTWWLQVEYFLVENEIKKNGFREELFFAPFAPGIKEIILNSPMDQVKDLVYAILSLSSFWEKNSSGFRD